MPSLKAIAAAIEVAHSFGLQVHEPLPLRSTNNIVAWLRPLAIVAKVGTGNARLLLTELRVASELHALNAPVVAPASETPAVVHACKGFNLTFWRYHPQPAEWDAPSPAVASALCSLHMALARISPELKATLPSYMAELESVSQLLRDGSRLAALPDADRLLMIRAYDRLMTRLLALSPAHTHIALHGSPHPYNILCVDHEPRFIDFETACLGPCEWDLAHTDLEVPPAYSKNINAELLRVCRDMVSLKTAAWCWADAERGDLRYHAEIHLAQVKRALLEDTRSCQ